MKLLTDDQKLSYVYKIILFVLFSIAWLFIAPFIVTRVWNNQILPLFEITEPVAKYWHTFWIVNCFCGTIFGINRVETKDPSASSYVYTLVAIVIAVFIGSIVDCTIWNHIIVHDFECLVKLPEIPVKCFFAISVAYMIVTRKIKLVAFTEKDDAFMDIWISEDK